MNKVILSIVVMIGVITTSFGAGLHQVGGISTGSFPPPVMNFA
ncbi:MULTISPECIES: hypothetical protein [unclassified Francisella]|nr:MULTISPECIES: hypothetical protein [unclassified Francisella]MED7819399.1 hypothetical protein [Francisella sp. 19S2-4]MED7830188.1 hypothetical protein [Francisella sp. 19S2-10]